MPHVHQGTNREILDETFTPQEDNVLIAVLILIMNYSCNIASEAKLPTSNTFECHYLCS